MKKKILGILAAFTLIFTGIFGFVGCDNKETPAAETTTNANEQNNEQQETELTEDQMLELLQTVLTEREGYDGSYEMAETMSATPTQNFLDLIDTLEAQLEAEQAKDEPDPATIAQLQMTLYAFNNMMMSGVRTYKMGYDTESNRAYQISSQGLTADEQFVYDYEFFVERENNDPTKKYLNYEKYYSDSDEEFHYNVSFVSANYVQNRDFMGEEESAEQESLMKLATILGATSVASLKESIADFKIEKVDGGYKASYSFTEEHSELADGFPTENKAAVYFNDNYITKVELKMTLQFELYTFGMPGAQEGELTDMFVITTVIDMGYNQFTEANMAEVENENFNVEEADYKYVYVDIRTTEGEYVANCGGQYLETYGDLSDIYVDGDLISLEDYLDTHTLYTDIECTHEFVYDANAILPDYDITLYEQAE